jgi:hypothetical protein
MANSRASRQAAGQTEAAAEPARSRPAPADDISSGNVDKIRDILFGSQMRDYEGRFLRLEERVDRDLAEIRETAKKRSDSLEVFVKRELETLQSRLKTEREERSEGARLLSRDLKELADVLGKKIVELDDHVAESHGHIRADILQQSKDLSEDMQRKQEEMAGALERRFQQLRSDKTDRAMLADLLIEVAMRLKDEFQIPAAAG